MRIHLIGGFLGSGKTTAIVTASKIYSKGNIDVAVVTNDQGEQIVDSALIQSLDIAAGEVRNGCFCCNYQQFHEVIAELQSSFRPSIIFAEAVGSCADLVSTIVKPMRLLESNVEVTLTVFTDAQVLLASLERRSSFTSDNIRYIYKKQLEEAGLIIVNKRDTLTEKEIETIENILHVEYPSTEILFQDSRDEASVCRWLTILENMSVIKKLGSLEIDYSRYADGEAALAWLDASIVVRSGLNAADKCLELVNGVAHSIFEQHLPVGHLKFFLDAGGWQTKISFTNREATETVGKPPDLTADSGRLLINARIETNPGKLKHLVMDVIDGINGRDCDIEIGTLTAFQPGYPRPTHRMLD